VRMDFDNSGFGHLNGRGGTVQKTAAIKTKTARSRAVTCP
jgi:hypothetical protein